MAKQALIDEFKDFYDELESDKLDELANLYHEDVTFSDPIHQIVGRDQLHDYFKNLMENVEYCHFAFDDELVTDEKAFFAWQMRYSHPKLASGAEIVLPGVTYLTFADGKIRTHQDFYDVGAMLYEHVPLVGYVIDKIKQRLVND
ncbi:nuclear transport factor 2 family protein [Idiomarina xiamenensis]|uniref:Ketosteroid isomerase-like protein n=1 Tax=Idiomarina xiamenensis 10-D-4 TaxID=740709 RepID=K2JTX9_9GAMM|nr:nuclear transport factor 2 family protein [Idiomarina xiamenensis]EKE86901.1 ketosteroid isomerase-like protein [Idiomarina xiamenensis 10-D-4]